jgi:hypothetical protein
MPVFAKFLGSELIVASIEGAVKEKINYDFK